MGKMTLDQWDERYEALKARGLSEPYYGGPLSRHACQGDRRLTKLTFDSSAAALRLWNFLLTEEERLHQARKEGKKIIGVMKDLGTIPVLAFSFPAMTAFYPDGAWWLPCFKESGSLLAIADRMGIGDSFCPVRAMLGAFVTEQHFPIPDLLTCSVGATCDDFSVIAQRVALMGFPVTWWEIPHRRRPHRGEDAAELPGGFIAPRWQVDFVRSELERIKKTLEELAGIHLDDEAIAAGIREANRVRRLLQELRNLVFGTPRCPLPALEMTIAEMLAIHFCSDRDETIRVLQQLRDETVRRIDAHYGVLEDRAVPLFWINPVADLRVMNLLEECGGRLCGTEYLFSHALDDLSEEEPPMEALACAALADPMAGSSHDRGERICRDIRRWGAEGVVISRIPGASHCAAEGAIIRDIVRSRLDLPVIEIEVPPVSDSLQPALRTRLEALIELAAERRYHAMRRH